MEDSTVTAYYKQDDTYALKTVPDTAVIGVLDGFYRKGRQYKTTDRAYRLYIRFWNLIYPLRALCFRGRRLAVRIARKLHILPWIRRMRGRRMSDHV